MSPKTGRPKAENPKGLRFSIRLDNDLASRLDDYCNKNNCKNKINKCKQVQMHMHLFS